MAHKQSATDPKPLAPAEPHADGWKNTMTGLGKKSSDKRQHTHFGASAMIVDQELASMYAGDGIAARIVNVVADDATKNGFTIGGDSDNAITNALIALQAAPKIADALRWARCFGGALIMLETNDGLPLDQPLRPRLTGKPIQVTGLRVYARTRVNINFADLVQDPYSPYFESVEKYRIRKLYGGEFEVHSSRLLVFKGAPCPDIMAETLTFDHRFWGLSVLQKVYTQLGGLGAVLAGVETMGAEFSIGKLKLSNLSRLVAENNYKAIETRMEAIALQKSIIKMVLLGEGEEFVRDNLNGSGLDTIIDRLFRVVSTCAEIPEAVLFGKPQAGLNSNGEEDTRRYYDGVKTTQEYKAQPPLLILAQFINAGLGTIVPIDELTAKWNACWVMSETDTIKNRNVQAQTDKIYIEAGVLNAGEVTENRFANGYSYETSVETMNAAPQE